jgi:hypothetical protein
MGIVSLRAVGGALRDTVRYARDPYNLDKPYPLHWSNPRFWFGKRWFVVVDDGIMTYEPYFRYFTDRQMAHHVLREAHDH